MDRKIITWLVGYLIKKVDKGLLREWLAEGLDMLQDKIKASENKVDDMLLPVITMIRKELGLPDYD